MKKITEYTEWKDCVSSFEVEETLRVARESGRSYQEGLEAALLRLFVQNREFKRGLEQVERRLGL